MMRRVTLLTLPLVFLTSPVWAGDEPKNTDEAIAKYVEAIGGRARMDAVKTRRASGKMVMEGGMELPVAIELKRPNKFRSDSTFQGMTMTQAYDGAVGWMIMPFAGKTDPEKMSPEQIKLVESQSDMDGPLVDYQKKGHQVEYLGKDDFEGSPTYKLKVAQKTGEIEYYYLDVDSYLPIAIKGKREFMGSPIEYEMTLGDYKAVDGMLLPHSMVYKSGPAGGGTVVIEKIETNPDLADSRFTMPEPKPAEAPGEKKGDDAAAKPADGKPSDAAKPAEQPKSADDKDKGKDKAKDADKEKGKEKDKDRKGKDKP